MKAIKYLFLAALTAGYSTAAMAQDGTKADVQAVKNIISSKPADLDKQIKPFYKKNKKNAENLVAFGREFYAVKDTARAKEFALYALEATKNKCAPAFILLGDIEAIGDNGGQAAAQYEQAIYVDPKNPEAYYKYANVYSKISPRGAVMKLEELRQQRPDIAVDALAGRIYYKSNDFDAALRAYDKADKNLMEERDLSDYAMTAFFNSTELQKWDDALAYADALFNKSDSAKFSYYDYTYYGNALSGAKQYDKAVAMYMKALEQEDMDNKAKRAGVIKQLSDAYKAQEDFPNAIKNYEDYLNNVEKASANDIAALAQLHLQHANKKQSAAEQAECFKKADQTYQDLENKFEDAAEYATFMRARVNSYMDTDQKLGLAKPFYEKLDQLIGGKENKDATDKARLIESYRYLISYYFVIQEDKENAKQYAEKLLAIDPNNEIAKQVMDAMK